MIFLHIIEKSQEVYIMKFKKWIPGIMLGVMMAIMTSGPVMAGNISSGSTPPG